MCWIFPTKDFSYQVSVYVLSTRGSLFKATTALSTWGADNTLDFFFSEGELGNNS